MLPVVALVGRPNVGKSTLFNKLTRSRDALVADLPGLTRDRQYGDGKLGDFPYIVIDTGGLSDSLNLYETANMSGVAADKSKNRAGFDSLDSEMRSQTVLAIEESDVVFFMVDGRAGCTAGDEQLAVELRKVKANVILVVNKIDGIGEEQARSEFFALGLGEPVSISAAHSRGLHTLVQYISPYKNAENQQELQTRNDAEPDDGADDGTNERTKHRVDPDDESVAAGQASAEDRHIIKLAFIGRPNVGKSTLVNRVCGEERVIAYDQPGTTRDTISVPFQRAGKDYHLIDTAGVRKRGKVNEVVEKFSIIKTLQAIESANVCVYLIDASDSITDQDLHLLGYIIDKGRAVVVAVNKWDAVSTDSRQQIREDLERRVGFLRFTSLHFISALKGSGVNDLLKSANRAHASAFTDLSTPKLTRLLELAVEQHQPPMVNGRRIKLRFAHQGGVNPPVIVVHGNQTEKVPGAYQRFLVNFFQKQLRLFGTPLRIRFKQGENPYADRKPARSSKNNSRRKSPASNSSSARSRR